jgi:carbonic anhydrase
MKHSASFAFAVAAVLFSVGCAPQPAPEIESPASPPLVSSVLTAEAQQALTPEQVLADLKAGNQRFVSGALTARDYMAQAEATAAGGQFPKAAILGCVDSRVPPEIIFDQGIGDVFVGRVAGNVEDVNLLGSLEFATKVAGSKVVVILGHTACGAIKGAADGVEMGNLTELLNDFDAPIARADEATEGEASSSNTEFLNLAIEENVRQTITDMLDQSEIMSDMVEGGELLIVGGVYDLATGQVKWLDS